MPPSDGTDTERRDDKQAETAAAKEGRTQDLTGDRVASYLGRHPDFFVEHADLLSRLTPPSRAFGEADDETASGEGTVVDLQHYMLRETRARAAELEGQLSEIAGLAREGMHGQARIQAAVLEIVAARDLENLVAIVTSDLAVTLDLDVVVLAVEGGAAERNKVPLFTAHGVRVMPEGALGEALGDADVVLRANISGDRRLYGATAELVRSEALIRLPVVRDEPPAMLAMGVRRSREFSSKQGTDLMSFLGDVLTLSIRTRLGGGSD